MNKDKSETRNNTHLAVVGRWSSVSGRPRNTLWPAMIKPFTGSRCARHTYYQIVHPGCRFSWEILPGDGGEPRPGSGAIQYLEIARSRWKLLISSFSSWALFANLAKSMCLKPISHEGQPAPEELAQNHMSGTLCNASRVAYLPQSEFVNAISKQFNQLFTLRSF